MPAIRTRRTRQSSRNSKRGLYAALFWVAGLLAALIIVSPGLAHAGDENTTAGRVSRAFVEAALRWDVPHELLLGIGYVESHWAQRPGEASLDGGDGIMHLLEGPGGSLERAAKLSGLSVEALKADASANIEGGAAVLHDISLKNQPGSTRDHLGEWVDVVGRYSGATDAIVRDMYARQVYDTVRTGAAATLESGEQVILRATPVGDLPAPAQPVPLSDDYPGALWVPASPSNYTAGRPYGSLNWIVIHDTEGSYISAINWFQNPTSGVSAHYVIRSVDGQITQMVRESNTAWHAGVWDYNVRSIGVEHEGYMSQPGWYTEAMYQSSAALVRTIANRYGILKDHAHIIGHEQIPNQTHRDPGPYWNWDHYLSLVRRDDLRAALVDNTDYAFTAVPTPIDPQHYWNTYPGGSNGSNAYQTYSVSSQAYSVNSGTWLANLPSAGNYDVYAYVPYVDNSVTDTENARYAVSTSSGLVISHVSQKAITDIGTGGWAHLGAFAFSAGPASVRLDDYTGESGRNVWFDAIMWIPTTASPPPVPTATFTPTAPRSTSTPTWTPSRTPTPAPTWTPGPCGMRFVDLPDSHWAYGYVSYLYCRGIISGYADGTFRPGESTTRGQLAKMIALGFGWTLYNPYYPTFSDVLPGTPYYQYVETCYVRGVVSGYSDGTFRPGSPVTRSQVTKMLVLAKEWAQYFPFYPDFTDVAPDNWAYGYVESAYSHGIVSGYADGTFRPGLPVNRSQFSKMLALTLQSWRDSPRTLLKTTPTTGPKRPSR